jgi:hypothetical protein
MLYKRIQHPNVKKFSKPRALQDTFNDLLSNIQKPLGIHHIRTILFSLPVTWWNFFYDLFSIKNVADVNSIDSFVNKRNMEEFSVVIMKRFRSNWLFNTIPRTKRSHGYKRIQHPNVKKSSKPRTLQDTSNDLLSNIQKPLGVHHIRTILFSLPVNYLKDLGNRLIFEIWWNFFCDLFSIKNVADVNSIDSFVSKRNMEEFSVVIMKRFRSKIQHPNVKKSSKPRTLHDTFNDLLSNIQKPLGIHHIRTILFSLPVNYLV